MADRDTLTAASRAAQMPEAAASPVVPITPEAVVPLAVPITPTPETVYPAAPEPVEPVVPPVLSAPLGPPVSELDFIGCDAVSMTYEQLLRYEGRLEVWDAEARTAWMVRDPTSADHEGPSHGLAGLVERIGAVRGSPITCFGSMDLLVRDEHGKPRRIMQADQTVYLRPSRVELLGAGAMVVGRHNYPDVVLEVDHTTDVRRGKLKLYEAWGFPELWVEVPDRRAPSRPKSRLPGLTIHRLVEGVYRECAESAAFPGWRSGDIHEAMNEVGRSARTNAILERLGRSLGAREGTGPDDDSLLRSLRDERHSEGRAEGLVEGRMEGRAKMARQMLLLRGIEVSEGFPADVPAFAGLSEADIIVTASACDSEQDFRARIGRLRGL